jgi:antitoxin (DNA-binding transcriptional repressor) of toxin-antitoxin stability system
MIMAATETTVSATEFKAKCLALIDDMNRTKIPVVVTKRGKRVAEMRPAGADIDSDRSLIGWMKGSVLRYDDPFSPAIDPSEWNALK